ncbi:hypothetical protein, conserved [Plasmodium gonderi]|uniref:Uncharacterized protein n=1 Tax=Plasmodium gonderi TaxID=77519 RepID=A0A1Y1JPS7_PLAGO|nr:hypothetical protein, conserved [Plasmodium gonderi]GAW83237.1 hypothetical protein, conserved [Plasmodium gonderi]
MNFYLREKRICSKCYNIRGSTFPHSKKSQHVRPFSQVQIPKRVGFMKPAFKLNRKAQKYIVNVQWLKSNNTKELEKLCNNIRKDANSFNSYEIIDLIYYLSKHSNKNVYLTIEPLLFHFFLKFNTSINLNGVSIHRLLRVLTEYQDLVYREWIYSIAKIISRKHAHISMRDIQLILDDLALFYDFQIHCQIIPFYNTIIKRIHELEIKRLPFLIHVIGRIGCNNQNLINTLVTTLKKYILKNDLYRSDFSGLLLRGLANLKVLPEKNILYQLYKPVKENIYYTNIKYISWCADGFSRLNFFSPLPLLVNQMLQLKEKITQLELNDFVSILNCIQAYILIKQYNSSGKNLHMLEQKKKNSDHSSAKISLPNDDRNSFKQSTIPITSTDGISTKSKLSEDNHWNTTTLIPNEQNCKNRKHIYFSENIEHIHLNRYENEDLTHMRKKNNLNMIHENNVNNQGKKYDSIQRSPTDKINLYCEEDHTIEQSLNKKKIKKEEEIEKKNEEYNPSVSTNVRNKPSYSLCRSDNYSNSIGNETFLHEMNSIFDINDKTGPLDELYDIYLKLEKIILEKITESIYNSTPPYRVIMFELLTRLFRFYKKPIDLIVHMNTHRYDNSLLLKYTNSLPLVISNKNERKMSNSGLSFHVNEFNFSNEFFFKNSPSNKMDTQKHTQDEENNPSEKDDQRDYVATYTKMKNDEDKQEHKEQFRDDEINKRLQNVEKRTVLNGKDTQLNVNIPLPKIFKNFLHSIFFRTPALGGRTIMLLLIALVRLNFGEREKFEYSNKADSTILPFSKANVIYRPLTKCVIREIIRKLESFNSEELIICAMCLNELDALNLNDELFSLLIERLFNLSKNNYMSKDQLLQLKSVFHFWYNQRRYLIVKNLRFKSIKQFKSFLFV